MGERRCKARKNAMVKRALVMGSARCLRADLEGALSLAEFECVIACKGAGLEWQGRLDAWVTLHPDRFARELAQRRGRGWALPDRTYAHADAPGVSHTLTYRWPDQKTSGSSGLFALRIAIEEYGCDRIVLCGIPLDKEYGRLDLPGAWRGATAFKQGWEQALHRIKDKTRSMSGWTKQLLGEPTAQWLHH